MGQTRMFRDRVVSMEQTLEGGEKHLPLLKDLCREALPELEFREYALDHERDLFVMDFASADGGARRICWTRMVLFDAERIPAMASEAGAALRGKIVDFLRARASSPEIVVTFRHLEEGWVDTPEPRREGRRRRRGGRGRGQSAGGGQGANRQERGGQPRPVGGGRQGGGAPPGERRLEGPPGGRRLEGQPGGRRPGGQPGGRRPEPQRPAGDRGPGGDPRGPQPPRPTLSAAPESAGSGEPGSPGEGAGRGRRRRFRRRRRGRGGAGGGGGPAGSAGPSPGEDGGAP